MKKLLIAAALLSTTTLAVAGPRCTDGDRTGWMSEDAMKTQIHDQGYEIKKFKVSSGGCYEFYGYDQAHHRVEIYYHPVTGEIMKKEIDD